MSVVMTTLFEVWFFTCATGLIGGTYSVSLAGLERVLLIVQHLRHGSSACGLGTSTFP
jgi:hypothetical protein